VAVIAICAALFLCGVAMAGRWHGRSFREPEELAALSPVETARRFIWYASLALVTGLVTGVTVIGAGGRLAMRLLAVTSGDDAQGRITEAEEVVGKITIDGTIGFVLFVGVFGGIITATLYLVLRRFLPPGWLGGVVFGVGLLVVLGTTIDPLRDDNPDFGIVGPGWLALVVFGVQAVVLGLALAGASARLSEWLPLPAKDRRVLLRYLGPAVLAAVAFSVTAVLAVVCLLVVAATRWRPLVNAVKSRRAVLVGRVATLGVVAIALPNALGSVIEIVS
jgi:hypothetical protein